MRPLDFADLMIVDDIMPSDFSPFRTIEYQHYLRFFNSALLSLEGWHAWIGNESFDDLLEKLPIDADLKSRIVPFRTHSRIIARLAYFTFLGNAIRLMPYLESRGIPFVLQLYPGGGFEIDRPETDEKLRRVLLSGLCRRVIVTQRITERYIVDKIGFDSTKIEHVFGGVFESRVPFSFDRDKLFFPKDKSTIDLCFVAHKYAGNITSKGYDQFAAIAVELAGAFTHLRFHVVGDYVQDDAPLGDHGARFTFYGRRSSAFLADFYKSMDAIISINRPFDLASGAFDGFPTGGCIEAGFRGVLNCINDPLDLNPCLIDGQDIILLNLDHQRSAARLWPLLENPTELYRIAEQGWRKFHHVFDTDRQLWARTRVIAEELTRHEGLIVRPSPNPSTIDEVSFHQALLPYRQHIAELEAKHQTNVPGTDQVAGQGAEAHQVAALSNQLNMIMASTSWRLTAPLRRILDPHPKLARFGRQGLKLIWWTISLQLVSRYRRRVELQAAMPDLEPVRLDPPAVREDPGPAAMDARSIEHQQAAADSEEAPLESADRLAKLEGDLSSGADRITEIERVLSLRDDGFDRLAKRVGELQWEIRWDQTRTDFVLGAIEGMREEAERLQAERQTADFQAVFEETEPLVSVCVATADRVKLLLERCIPSLLAQTYRNLQIVVVGDHCMDDTEERIAKLGDERVSFVNLAERGPYPPSGRERWCVAGSNAMNAALALCRGHFITHLDDDDRYATDRIERLVKFSLERKAEFCWHSFWAEHDDGHWDVIGDGRFAVNQVTPGAVFYHRYFARFKWDPLAYQTDEPGDWNRFRKIKMARPRSHFVNEPLLHHHRERQQSDISQLAGDVRVDDQRC